MLAVMLVGSSEGRQLLMVLQSTSLRWRDDRGDYGFGLLAGCIISPYLTCLRHSRAFQTERAGYRRGRVLSFDSDLHR